jgi:hypothetical protein
MIVGLAPGERFTLDIIPAGSMSYPQTYSADTSGQFHTITPAGAWTGIASFTVTATRATGQTVQSQYQLSP